MSRTNERGEVTTQVVLVFPVLLLVLLMVVHISVASHLGHVASAAAQAGARVASAAKSNNSDAATVKAVERALSDLNASGASIPTVTRTSSQVFVRVRLAVPSLVPFLPDHVTRTVVAPLEQFRTEGER